jgi:hypothetical protein
LILEVVNGTLQDQTQTIQHRRGRRYRTVPLYFSIQKVLNITESNQLWIHTRSYQYLSKEEEDGIDSTFPALLCVSKTFKASLTHII